MADLRPPTCRRSLAASSGVLVALAVISAACSSPLLAETGQPILGVEAVDGEPDALRVIYSGCDEAPPIRVAEDDDEVVITVVGPDEGCEPLFSAVVTLDQPVGDRVVVDATTGQAMQLTRTDPPG